MIHDGGKNTGIVSHFLLYPRMTGNVVILIPLSQSKTSLEQAAFTSGYEKPQRLVRSCRLCASCSVGSCPLYDETTHNLSQGHLSSFKARHAIIEKGRISSSFFLKVVECAVFGRLIHTLVIGANIRFYDIR